MSIRIDVGHSGIWFPPFADRIRSSFFLCCSSSRSDASFLACARSSAEKRIKLDYFISEADNNGSHNSFQSWQLRFFQRPKCGRLGSYCCRPHIVSGYDCARRMGTSFSFWPEHAQPNPVFNFCPLCFGNSISSAKGKRKVLDDRARKLRSVTIMTCKSRLSARSWISSASAIKWESWRPKSRSGVHLQLYFSN